MHLLTVRHIVPKAKLDLQKLQDKLKAARRKPSTYQVGGSFTNIYELLIVLSHSVYLIQKQLSLTFYIDWY